MLGTVKQFISEDRYDPQKMIELNKKEKQYKEYDAMFEIIKDDKAVDILRAGIDLESNIVICIEGDENLIERRFNGSLDFKTNRDCDLSNSRVINQVFSVQEFNPRLKICVPKGIEMSVRKPIVNEYINTMYAFFNIIERKHIEKKIPGYVIYNNFKTTSYFDLGQFKKRASTLMFKKYSVIFNMAFHPIYFMGSHTFPNLEKVYQIQNTEVFKNFEEIF